MSKRYKKKSSEKDDDSEDKKPEKAELGKSKKNEQLSQRLRDNVVCTKLKRSLDLKESTKDSKDVHHICDNLAPLEEREKISVYFKNKAKHVGKRSNVDSVAAFPSKEEFDTTFKRKKKELQDLWILNSREKYKKKDKVEHKKLKEKIKKHVLVEFKDTLHPTDCSLVHKKKALDSYYCIRKHSTSKELNASAFNFSGPKMHIQNSREETYERAKHSSLEQPSKNEKEMKCQPLCHTIEQPKPWRDKQKEEWRTDTAKNTDHVPIQEFTFKPVTFRRSQSSEALTLSSFGATGSTDADEEMQIVEDLHAARNDKKIVLPVVQTCGELTSMEIDLPDEESNLFSKTHAGLNALIVIDTNIMISHLEFVKSLKNRDIPGIGRFVLVIPWVVLQELDNLKRGKMLANVGEKAIPAVHFIYMCLKNQDPKLWGQSMQLASQKTYNFVIENNDDRVLQCCLQYRNLFPQAEVVLLTDDKNLCNKALVSEVKAFTKVDFVTMLQKLAPKTAFKSQYVFSGQPQSEKDTESQKTEEVMTDQISGIIFDTKKCLGEVLSCILETELKIAYGEDLWKEVVYRKPPWTLANLLECYKKHWMAVFGLIIARNFFSTIEYLYAELCKSKVITHSNVKKVLQKSKMLLETFCPRSNYDGALARALDQVKKLLEALEKFQSGTGANSSDTFKSTSGDSACEKMEDVILTQEIQVGDKSPASEPLAEGNKHMEIWAVLQTVWDTVNQFSLEVFQKLDRSAITNSQNMTAVKEALEGLQKLMAAVSEILSGIRQVLVPNSSFHNVWALYTFLTRSEIYNITFTAEELYDCISQEIYRNRLLVGYNQLAQLEHTIKQQYESVCFEIKSRGWL
nr:transcriptional protein SWT1 [Pogona vitticeps]XP_020650746.1 transcriptional protein SWT1 [Pogona vitticeps]XP_020650747.1 transcriptional protein SWT1 [Pogona vitticeps]XP_020650748.1 transcriptional protein SWT1 [Pogona vitticeps]XP_020650750.1 transcriptional protein SWT1 [Pogona vitticeps]XP_020650751.1 transcriptional protein SWT1 [Pogona vitticeps]XP_020650752.1 transcriptional protein SWT1 [Pogona vitticeps]